MGKKALEEKQEGGGAARQLAARGQPTVYEGEHLASLAFPLGGIGAGAIWLGGTGELSGWEIFNNVNKSFSLPGSFLALRTQTRRAKPAARVLSTRGVGKFSPVQSLRIQPTYPFVNIEFMDKSLPVELSLTAFNPLVPMSVKDSALPVAMFEVRVKNRQKSTVDVSVLASLQNAVGCDGYRRVSGVVGPGYLGNRNHFLDQGLYRALNMTAGRAEGGSMNRPVRVLILGPSDETAQYLALWPVGNLTVETRQLSVDPLPPWGALRARYDLVWLDGVPASLGRQQAEMLKVYVRQGGRLLLTGVERNAFLTPIASPAMAKGHGASVGVLADLCGVAYRGASVQEREERVRAISPQKDVFRGIDDARFLVRRYVRLEAPEPKAGATVLGRLRTGLPMVVESRVEKGRVLWVNADVVGPGSTPWRGAGAFIRNCVAHLAGTRYNAPAGMASDSPFAGTMALATPEDETLTYKTQWANLDELHREFVTSGELSRPAPEGSSDAETTFNGAMCSRFELDPGVSRSVRFAMGWCFANRFSETPERRYDPAKSVLIGNGYSQWFQDALSVMNYTFDHWERLERESRSFVETLYNSTLPHWLMDCVGTQLSTLRSGTATWTQKGDFGFWEGTRDGHGCCGINCTHVLHYAQSLSWLFPELERSITDVTVGWLQDPKTQAIWGKLAGWGDLRRMQFSLDSSPEFVLKVYRDYRRSGDEEFLKRVWPGVCGVLDYMAGRDTDRDGLPNMNEHNGRDGQLCDDTTYDAWAMYGTTSFVGGLWLAALRAGREMAVGMKDRGRARQCESLYKRGVRAFESKLWNEEYYALQHDPARPEMAAYSQCLLSDHLTGQWFAHMVGLGQILPAEHVRQSLASVVRHNFGRWYDQYLDVVGRGLLTSSWPKGGEVPEGVYHHSRRLTQHTHTMFTGVEFAVASHLIYEGMVAEGLAVANAVWERYDGRQANPFNHIECGENTARAMSSWALLLAATGIDYDASKARLGFAPRVTPGAFRGAFVAGQGWGTVEQRREKSRQVNKVGVGHGAVGVRTFAFVLPEDAQLEAGKVKVLLGKKEVRAKIKVQDRRVEITFARTKRIEQDTQAVIELPFTRAKAPGGKAAPAKAPAAQVPAAKTPTTKAPAATASVGKVPEAKGPAGAAPAAKAARTKGSTANAAGTKSPARKSPAAKAPGRKATAPKGEGAGMPPEKG